MRKILYSFRCVRQSQLCWCDGDQKKIIETRVLGVKLHLPKLPDPCHSKRVILCCLFGFFHWLLYTLYTNYVASIQSVYRFRGRVDWEKQGLFVPNL